MAAARLALALWACAAATATAARLEDDYDYQLADGGAGAGAARVMERAEAVMGTSADGSRKSEALLEPSEAVSDMQWGTMEEQEEVKEVSSMIGTLESKLKKFGQNAEFDKSLLALPAAAPEQGRYAYVLCATDEEHALASCTVANLLRDLGKSPSIDIIGLHAAEKGASDVLRKCGQFDRLLQTDLEAHRRPVGYYHDVAVKFAPFGEKPFTDYDRLLIMDSDLHPLKNLDFLFNVPAEFKVFAPRAYWISPDTMMTGLYGVKPDAEVHQALLQQWGTQDEQGNYPPGDMDVVNDFYHDPARRKQMGLLPANFLVLDSHWHNEEERKAHVPNAYPSLAANSLDSIYTIHFSGYQKPWYHTEEDDISHFDDRYKPLRKQWWAAYKKMKAKVAEGSKVALIEVAAKGMRRL